MIKHITWWLRGSAAAPRTVDEHADAIRDLQHKLEHLSEVAARTESMTVEAIGLGAVIADVAERLDRCQLQVDRLDEIVAEVVRVVAPPGES